MLKRFVLLKPLLTFFILFICSFVTHAQQKWVTLASLNPWPEELERHGGFLAAPATSIITLPDDQILVSVARAVEDYFNRDPLWDDDIRVMFELQNGQVMLAKASQGAIGRSKAAYVVTTTYMPITPIKKSQVKEVHIQGRATPERLAEERKRIEEKQLQQKRIAALMSEVPFPEAKIGQPFSFELTTVDNVSFDSKSHLGKVVVVDFYFINCSPCKRAWPILRQLTQNHNNEEMVMLGVSIADSTEEVKQLVTEEQLTWPQVAFANPIMPQAIQQKLMFSGAPHYLVIDKQGHFAGIVGTDELTDKVMSLL